MPLSSYCRVCGKPNTTTQEMSANHCNGCEERRNAAMTAFVDAHPNGYADSDRLAAGREAMYGGSRNPRADFINPRNYNRFDKTGGNA